MKTFRDLCLISLLICVFGCDEGMQIVDPVMPDLMGLMGEQKEHEHDPVMPDLMGEQKEPERIHGEPPVGYEPSANPAINKNDIKFWTYEDLAKLQWSWDPIDIRYGGDPSGGPQSWDRDSGMLLTRPNMMTIPIRILDPERNCMLKWGERQFTEVEGFIEPHKVEIFNWDTGEPFRFHMSRWDGEPPEPIHRRFQTRHTNKDSCPRKWFYYSGLPIYLKYVDETEADKKSRVVGITPEEMGIRIEFENGDKLTWNLAEIYPEFPLMPPFRLDK